MGSVRDWQKKDARRKRKERNREVESLQCCHGPPKSWWMSQRGKLQQRAPFQRKKNIKKNHQNPARSATHDTSRRYHKPCLYYFIIIFLLLFTRHRPKTVSASLLVFFFVYHHYILFSNLPIPEKKDTCYLDFVTFSTNQSNSLPYLERKSQLIACKPECATHRQKGELGQENQNFELGCWSPDGSACNGPMFSHLRKWVPILSNKQEKHQRPQ